MADRKQFQNVPTPDPELMRLLDESRTRVLTEEELREHESASLMGMPPQILTSSQRKGLGLRQHT